MERYGRTNIKSIKVLNEHIKLEVLNEYSKETYIDYVEIPKSYMTDKTLPVVIEQLISNDLKNVGYRYIEFAKIAKEPFKTIPKTQIVGTMKLILNEITCKQ